jgi:hypothetical protein
MGWEVQGGEGVVVWFGFFCLFVFSSRLYCVYRVLVWVCNNSSTGRTVSTSGVGWVSVRSM